ncbi:HTH-type transcriptional regulator MalT [Dictyobacter alpinus]|uniref:HTH-type transcriptional regulator MalT n=1 Tax=Dictyobacter alpinus TaxID=2014873 RepID=A0A402BJZ1_9CHLR|nr:LuxR C-terminal-related transcriptional regulator [Dictyobacter alpinus]GCE31650.1 HTH-type transcriptional regulator MalT [Dictyobacter alpinus]
MPKSARYTLLWSPEQATYVFTGPSEDTMPAFGNNRDEWLPWLETQHSFAFAGRHGRINLLKEQRRNSAEGYWYAYRRHQGRMRKRYLGLSSQLSIEKLEELAALLTHEPAVTSASPATAPTSQSKTGNVNTENIRNPTVSALSFEPLLIPKLQLPQPQKSLLSRERLWRLLDQGLEHKLTLISGPAGYGKTTAVSQWIAQGSSRADFPRVASVNLDEEDNDVVRFWRYLIAACQLLLPHCGGEALELLRAHRLLPFKSLHMMLTSLLNELSQLEEPAVLILDDCHLVNSPQVIESLSFFIDHLPVSLHLFMLLRGDPPLSISRLRARNELLDIYPPMLAFSFEETRAFFERELPFTLAQKDLRQIHEQLEGWATGLRLLARALLDVSNTQTIQHILANFTQNHWSIHAYLLEEVLHTLPTRQQEFLLQTSVLPLLTAPLCDVIRQGTDSEELIQLLRAGDMFLVPLYGSGEWARYHPLFAEVMRQEAQRKLGAERLRQLSAQASVWYEAHNLQVEAIEAALEAALFARAVILIEQLMAQREQHTASEPQEIYSLRRWLQRLPEEELAHHPDLCVQYAMSLLFSLMGEEPETPHGRERIQQLLYRAEHYWRDANNTQKLAEIFAFRALLARQEGNIMQAVTWARQALAWLPTTERTWRNLALTVVGVGEMLSGDLTAARKILLEALALSEQLGNFLYARATRGMLGGASFELGELHHTSEQFRQILHEARAQEDRDDIARMQLGLAQIMYQWNQLDAARQAAQEALELSEQLHAEDTLAHATMCLATIEQAQGQSEQAQQRLTAWLVRAQTTQTAQSYQLMRELRTILARFQLARANQTAVQRWFASVELKQETLPLLQRRREQLMMARYLLAREESSAAITQLEELYASAKQTGHVLLTLEVLVVLVLAYTRQGTQAKAHEQLQLLLHATHSEGYQRLFVDEGEEMARLLRDCLPRIQPKALQIYAKQLLNAFDPQPTHSATGLSGEPLSQQEQKVLRLLSMGNTNAEIARELVVSVNTVRSQVQSIYRKLDVSNRMQASARAKQLKLRD